MVSYISYKRKREKRKRRNWKKENKNPYKDYSHAFANNLNNKLCCGKKEYRKRETCTYINKIGNQLFIFQREFYSFLFSSARFKFPTFLVCVFVNICLYISINSPNIERNYYASNVSFWNFQSNFFIPACI